MIEPLVLSPDLDEHGALLHSGLAVPLLEAMRRSLSKWPDGRAGARISGDSELARLLGENEAIGRRVTEILGRSARPVRAVLFDKGDAADWSLGWHQDRTIAVRKREAVEGFSPWSVKQGITHVEPPFAVIEAMITVRIHLDSVDRENAPLLIALGSHRRGRVAVTDVDTVVGECSIQPCLAEEGDVWFYRTPILHASESARASRRRRVLQVDYAAVDLPAGLEWLGI